MSPTLTSTIEEKMSELTLPEEHVVRVERAVKVVANDLPKETPTMIGVEENGSGWESNPPNAVEGVSPVLKTGAVTRSANTPRKP